MDNDAVACRGVTVGDDLSLSGGSQNVHTVEKDVFKATTKICLKNGSERAKIGVLTTNSIAFFLTESGVPPAPLTENHCAQKSLAELGGTAPPLTEKNPLKSF